MRIKTTDATPLQLDWLVAKCLDGKVSITDGRGGWLVVFQPRTRGATGGGSPFPPMFFSPSKDWSQGGPIIERDGIELQCNTSALQAAAYKNANPDWFACLKFKRADHWHGTTPLIAAMRCYVASKLGDEVEIPEELT